MRNRRKLEPWKIWKIVRFPTYGARYVTVWNTFHIFQSNSTQGSHNAREGARI